MIIFNTKLPAGNSGKVSLDSTFETTSTVASVMRPRQKKRLRHGLPLARLFGAYGRRSLTRNSYKASFNKLRGRPYRALKSASDRLEIHCWQRKKSTIFSKQISFSSGYFVGGLYATQQKFKTKTTFDPIFRRAGSTREFFLAHVHSPASYSAAEDFGPVFFDILVKVVNNSSSPSIHDVLGLLRLNDLELASNVLFQESDGEDTDGVGSINSKFLLDNKHESKPIYDESASAEAKIFGSLIETFWKRSDGGPQSLAAQSTSSGSVISENGKPKYSSTISTSKGNKRSRIAQERDNGGDDENGEERNSKRPKTFLIGSETTDRKFACPYRKHNPQKYSVQKWRSCALTPLETVARLKGHLYRHHRIFQCQRCKVLFPSQDDVQTHLMAAQACEISTAEPVDGITSDIVDRLRSRKKTYPGQTEEDRWREVYKMLFPHEIIPSPYFEPVRENEVNKSGAIEEELGAYEQYIRRELPRAFWTALEEAAILEAQPIAESLRRQLVDIISDVQNRVLASYRATINPLDEPVTTASPSQPRYHTSEANEQTLSAISILTPPESLFQPPPPTGGGSHDLDIVDRTCDLHPANSDPAYISEKSTEPKRNRGDQ